MATFPTEFTENGFFAPRFPAAPITRFQVLGERSSGTNYATRIIGRNSSLKHVDVLGWKHGFPQAVAIPADLAVICVVRRAEEWALSMHKKPWHTGAQLQALEFGDFIKAPWDTYVDHGKYFPDAVKQGYLGRPLQLDRHPVTGNRFPNLFALRRAKLAGLLSHLNRQCTCVLLRAETILAEPEATLDAVLRVLDQPALTRPFVPVGKRLGSKFNSVVELRPKTPLRMGTSGKALLRKTLDLQLESVLGYTYD